MRVFLLRWFFFLGFVFLVGVAVWTVIAVQRMKRQQLLTITLLENLAAQAGLRRAVDRLASRKGDTGE